MKIGIYIDKQDAQMGGAASLLTTIQKTLLKEHGRYQFVILHDGRWFHPYKSEKDGITYVNVDAGRRKHLLWLHSRRMVHNLKNVKRWLDFKNQHPFKDTFLDRIVRIEGIDLIWFTYPVWRETSIPYIYTVWDLGHRVLPMFPEMNEDWYVREKMYADMLPHASYIITGNEEGKREILENYAVDSKKIRAVPFPVSSFCNGPAKAPDRVLPDTYFIYPAQFWPHKNHIVILRALDILRKKYDVTPAVLFTGSDKGNRNHVQNMCAKMELEDQVQFLGFVSYEELKYLYTHAAGMIFASLLGPNNLPPIEAAYLGCPVIVSDLPGHREQLKESVLYFTPTDEQELAERMYEVLKNQNGVNDRLRQAAEKMDFAWDYVRGVGEIFEEYAKFARTWADID